MNEQFAERAAITLLSEGESKRRYHKKRLAQSFCSPKDQPTLKKINTHQISRTTPSSWRPHYRTGQQINASIGVWSVDPMGFRVGMPARLYKSTLRNEILMLNTLSPAHQRGRRHVDHARRNYLALMFRFLAIHHSM